MARAERRRRRQQQGRPRATGSYAAAVTGAALAALLAVAGCSSSTADSGPPSLPAPSQDAGPAVSSYAALGDSFTAAPFVPTTDLADGCFRSDGNYPSLLAEALGVEALRDVSCSAAETGDVLGRQRVAGGQGGVPPQIRAVTPDTDLVTVGLGGNDEDLFASLVGCVGGLAPVPAAPATGACLDAGDPGPDQVVARTGRRVEDVLRAVSRRAPDATVVLVGYPRLLGETDGCPDFPVGAADVPAARALERDLRDALASAARRSDAEFLDAYALSAGHEICSDDPWVNGRSTDQARALAFHPFAEGQQAVADALEDLLADPGAGGPGS